MINITPIIDVKRQTNFVERIGSTGSMLASAANDIWNAVGLVREKTYVPYVSGNQPQGVTMYISCDNNAATQKIYVCGLDGNGHFIDEEIYLEGWIKKPLQKLYFRIFDAINTEDAITPAEVPDAKNIVYVYRNSAVVEGKPSTLSAIEAIISSTAAYSLSQSQMTHITVPYNMNGYVTNIMGSVNFEVAETRAIFYLMISPAGRTIPITQSFFWRDLKVFSLNTSGTSVIDIKEDGRSNPGLYIAPGTDIVMKAVVGAAAHIVTGSFTIRLEQII